MCWTMAPTVHVFLPIRRTGRGSSSRSTARLMDSRQPFPKRRARPSSVIRVFGDKVLRTIGQIIRNDIRHGHDAGFRYGGDEFAVILAGADATVALRIGERIRTDLEQAENFGTSLSIGIAEYKPGMNSADLTRCADEALYRAKSQGRNNVCVA